MSLVNKTKSPALELAIVMPVYNEEACIVSVIESWLAVINRLSIPATIVAINDGSKDGTADQLLQFEGNPGVMVINKSNAGHGPTIMEGYHKAVEMAEWVFQIDSDGELVAEDFEQFWVKRNDYDLLFGIRNGRDQTLGRAIISWMSRILVLALCGRGVNDVNVPFRLMRYSALKVIMSSIPNATFAPNVAIAGLALKHNFKTINISVSYNERQTGCCSLVKWNLIKSAIKSFAQTAVIFIKDK